MVVGEFYNYLAKSLGVITPNAVPHPAKKSFISKSPSREAECMFITRGSS